jgi:hypothetical protein
VSSQKATVYSMKDLIALLPISQGPTGSLTWRDFDVSVTVYHDQKTTFASEYWDGEKAVSRQYETGGIGFPMKNFRIKGGSDQWTKPIISFPDGFTEFLVDFQWSSSNNHQFFRLSSLRVRVDDGGKLIQTN